MRRLLLLASAAILGCGDSSMAGGAGAEPSGGAAETLAGGGSGGEEAGAGGSNSTLTIEQAFAAQGFSFEPGSFKTIDLSACCDEGKNCAGNNPTSPYGAFYVPAAPDQTVQEEHAEPDGTSAIFRMRADEAVVYIGESPPEAAYFGFTAYLMERTYENGDRRTPFASLGETLNNGVVAGDGAEAFGVPLAVIVSGDGNTEQKTRAALIASGFDAASIYTLVIDSSAGQMGLDLDDSTYGVLFRYALPEDRAAGERYLSAIPGAVYRLGPSDRGALDPLLADAPRAKGTMVEDAALETALDALESAVRAKTPDVEAQSMLITQGEPDPQACIETGTGCAGDNRDTNYPATLPQPFFTEPGEFYMVIGVDHRAVGKVAYSNFSFYALEHLVGITGVSDRDFAGTGAEWLPDEPLAGKLFAWKIARDCGADAHCTEIPMTACPEGISDGDAALIAFRTYLEPGTHTAPAVDTLIGSRVLRFRP